MWQAYSGVFIASHSPVRPPLRVPRAGKVDPNCAKAAENRYGGFLGPWLELPDDEPKA